MNAWETLKTESTLGDGFDAWEYLNSQGGGTGGSWPVLIDSLFIEVDMLSFEIEVDIPEYTIEVSGVEYEIEVNKQQYNLEVE